MLYPTTASKLKNGAEAVFRSPRKEDAAAMIEQLRQMTGETPFLLRTPEEVTMTLEQEERFIESINQSDNNWMILCEVDGRYAGNCHLQLFTGRVKMRHRGSVAIGLSRDFWGMGIGSAMFDEMIRIAREQGAKQLELAVVEGNERGLALYRKMGFCEYGRLPNALIQPDGSLSAEILMVCEL